MGTGADLFGDLVYKEALQGTPNPTLDDQFVVYDSVQKVLSAGIANINSTSRRTWGRAVRISSTAVIRLSGQRWLTHSKPVSSCTRPK